jgi:hypothetical protein
MEIPEGLDKANCVIIAYLQDSKNLRILGAEQATIK